MCTQDRHLRTWINRWISTDVDVKFYIHGKPAKIGQDSVWKLYNPDCSWQMTMDEATVDDFDLRPSEVWKS